MVSLTCQARHGEVAARAMQQMLDEPSFQSYVSVNGQLEKVSSFSELWTGFINCRTIVHLPSRIKTKVTVAEVVVGKVSSCVRNRSV